MTAKYRLYGFTSPTNSTPSFSTPVFEKDDSLYVQIIDKNEIIKDFEQINDPQIDCYQGGGDEFYSSGDEALFGVKDQFHGMTFNTKNKLKHYLRSKISDYIDTPYFYKSVSEFCEYSIPEFVGCETNRDYLVRQIVSNLMPEFTKISNVRLEHVRPKINSMSEYKLMKFENLQVTRPTIKLRSKYQDIRTLYEEFLNFAQIKHSRIASEKVFVDSLNMSKDVFSDWLDKDDVDYTFVKKHLVFILNTKLENNSECLYCNYKVKKTKEIRRFYTDKTVIESIKNNGQITADGVSFIIYVTSLLSKHAQDESDNSTTSTSSFPRWRHVTKQSR
ncbi:hypothetical protein I8Y06_001677 [Photobacterium damselae]|nr:hypothetical protein [Photobacterium damselae]